MRSYLSLSLKAATMFDNIESFMLCGLYSVENSGGGCVYVYMEVVCVCVYGGCVYVYVEVVGQNISCRLRLFRHTRVQPSQHSQQHNLSSKRPNFRIS